MKFQSDCVRSSSQIVSVRHC